MAHQAGVGRLPDARPPLQSLSVCPPRPGRSACNSVRQRYVRDCRCRKGLHFSAEESRSWFSAAYPGALVYRALQSNWTLNARRPPCAVGKDCWQAIEIIVALAVKGWAVLDKTRAYT